METQEAFPIQQVVTFCVAALALTVIWRSICSGVEYALVETWNDCFKTLLGMVELYSDVAILWLLRSIAACSRNCLLAGTVQVSDMPFWAL